jgi:hypothetical protein
MKLKTNRLLCTLFMAALPIGFTPAPDDSSETNFQLWGGAGQYALITRGCNNEILDKQEIPFSEVSAALDYKSASPVRAGVRGSYIRSKKESEQVFSGESGNYRYRHKLISTEIFAVNPFVNLEWKNFAFGTGYLWANDHLDAGNNIDKNLFSLYLRVGNPRTAYVDASFLHTSPLLSDGYLKMGLGSNRNPKVGWWLGLGGLPQDKAGLIARTNIRLRQHLGLGILARIGGSEGVSESAVSLGVTYQFQGKK